MLFKCSITIYICTPLFNTNIMKTKLLKPLLLLILMLSNFLIYAQGPGQGSDEPGDGLQGDDVPINMQLIYLALAGVACAYYVFKRTQTIKTTK